MSQNNEITIIQENPEVYKKLEDSNKKMTELSKTSVRATMTIEHTEKRMQEIIDILQKEFQLDIEQVPAFLNEAIPKNEENILKYCQQVDDAYIYAKEKIKV